MNYKSSVILFCCFSFLNQLTIAQVKQSPANMEKPPISKDRSTGTLQTENNEFNFFSEQFADFRMLRYQVPGFEQLTLQQKKLCYYLFEATLSGRDIFYDQSYKNNLVIRKTIEAIISSKNVDKGSDQWKLFDVYAKRVWFSNGIHHVYSNNKMIPECTRDWFAGQVRSVDSKSLPLAEDQSVEQFIDWLMPILYDPKVAPKRVNLDANEDLIKTSSVNFYENVSQQEVENYYKDLASKTPDHAPSFGLNSKLVKDGNGNLTEKQWKIGGMYSPAIEKIVEWLQKAEGVAESDHQKKVIHLLIEFYQTGDLKKFDDYSIAWAMDTSTVDFVNGFIEDYHDPLGYKGSWEAYVSIKDKEATKRIKAIGDQAQWFEDHSPIMDQHKKKDVKGISAKVINVVVECGDLAPLTAIGINLPNAD
jgi:dipeptidyl-peptidase-3